MRYRLQMLIESAIAALLLGGGTFGAYRASGVRRNRDAARRRRDDADREIGRTEEVLSSRRKALDESSRRYLDDNAKERLHDVSLDVLREQTAGSVKIAPLEQAGYKNVAELVGKSAEDLAAIKGIGAHSSKSIADAVRNYVAFVHSDAPPLPKAELERPSDVELGRNTLAFLEAWRELGDAPRRL
ncbi:MAG: hypothetical protein AAGD14_12110, partial [Planctomycetota bacterium]